MGKIASVLIKDDAHYGRDYFISGLVRLGYEITLAPIEKPGKRDVLLLWNRLPTQEHFAKRYEEAGATVLIAENGWIGDKTYALCEGYHNGAGNWFVGPESRWPSFGIEVKPWRKSGEDLLLIPQRGMGPPGIAMPRDWTRTTLSLLEPSTTRPIRVRYPEFRNDPLEPAFNDVHAVLIWGSGAGIKAIVAGIPVFYEMPNWIGAEAALRLDLQSIYRKRSLETPLTDDKARMDMLHTLSWAMWKAEEIATGEPFECVLR